MKSYCLGFAFCHEFTGEKNVLLIRKTKPEWMRGMTNGIGGKIEENEIQTDAMVREFREECGIETRPDQWIHYATLLFPDAVVYCFTTVLNWNEFRTWETKTEEMVVQCRVSQVWSELPMRNLAWLIPMAEAACEDASQFPLTIK